MFAAGSARSVGLAILCACLLLAGAASFARADMHHDDMEERFSAWQAAYDRVYATDAERQRRLEVYARNVEHIDSTNRRGGLSYKLGENQFTDLTGDEFRARYTVTFPPRQAFASRETARADNSSYVELGGEVPSSVDWRAKGAVTPIKSQMDCGSCWAFAAVASIESLNKIKTGHLVSLSEQEIMDCDTAVDRGCSGGYPGMAMAWVARNGGLAAASDYPYESKQGQCRRDRVRHTAKIRGGQPVERNSEAALERAVAQQPVTVLINAGGFQYFKAGVFSGACDAGTNHAVTVVGYGAEPGGRKYWIIKNSWGEGWGEKGYVRLERRVKAKEGMCGIAAMPLYPVM